MTPEQIATITRAYAFTPDDRAALTDVLAAAYLHAKQTAYQRARTAVGQRVSLPAWRPGDADATQAHEWAQVRAESIAETYEGLLRRQLEQMEEEQAREGLGGIFQGIKGVIQKIGDWLADFLGWKTDQIADMTWLEGDNDGTEAWIDDVRASGVGYGDLKVQILPESSSSDFCAQYAGGIYSYDDIGVVTPFFPAHVGCVHYVYVLPPDEQDS